MKVKLDENLGQHSAVLLRDAGPAHGPGIAVLRVPARPTRQDLDAVLSRLIDAMATRDPTGHLWAVNRLRVREYQTEDPLGG